MKIRLTPEQAIKIEFEMARLLHKGTSDNPFNDLLVKWCAENPIEVGEEQVISCHCCDDGVYKHFR